MATNCWVVDSGHQVRNRPPQFTQGYGLTFGYCERKAMAMAIVDRTLRADDFDEVRSFPAQDEEFVLNHSDNVEASGFLQHLKLPHYVDFQGELINVRELRRAATENAPQHKASAE